MPFERHMGDSAPKVHREQNENWQRLDDVAARLLAKCEQAINDGNFEAAETYHAQFVEVAGK